MESWGRRLRLRTRIWRAFKYPLFAFSERVLVILAILLTVAVTAGFVVLMLHKDAEQAHLPEAVSPVAASSHP